MNRSVSVIRTIGSITEMAGVMNETGDSISRLPKLTEEIDPVMGVVNDIANPTNVSALNATIQAARTDEPGRGSAVDADEARNTAERTAETTEDPERAATEPYQERRDVKPLVA
ncbi:MAG: methyl-accepting chemotaxis protein [Planctomycetota bacterium]